MARAPDERIEQAKAMYLKGAKLVEIASQLNIPEGTVRRWKCTHKWDNERSDKKANVRIEKKVVSLEIRMRRDMVELDRQRTGMLKNMDSFQSISLMRPGRFFLPLSRLIRLICSGTRSRLLTLLSFERRELPMCEINRTKRLKG